MPQIIDQKYNKICSSLQSEDKFRRKQALQEILNIIVEPSEDFNQTILPQLWEIFHRPVVRILHDPSEACRDLALDILKQFLLILNCSDKNIIYILPILTKRLGSQELIEQSEEVRLKCIIFIRAVVSKYQDKLLSHFKDLVTILTRTVTDKYPEVKRESCDCICDIAKALPSEFYKNSEAFIKPIVSNLTHRHYKIRVNVVTTLGEVLMYGNSKSMETVAAHLAERLFDQSGAVRAAVVEVSGKWIISLKDRYSWWYKLVPLILTGINDVVPEIRERAYELWLQAGEQYIKENEENEKFKEKLDYYNEDLRHYPPNIIRPNLGCRTIVQDIITRLLPALKRELQEWLADIKVRAAQLLCIMVLNVETEMIHHIENLLPAMYRACNEEDKRVVENVELAAEYTGYFVPPKDYLKFMMPTLEENPTTGHLKILAALIRGSPRDELVVELESLANYIQASHICQSRKTRYQLEILNCCRSLLQVCGEDCIPITNQLYTTIFTILACATEDPVTDEALKLLKNLSEIKHFESLDRLNDENLGSILRSIQECPENWTATSYEFLIFQTCLTHARTTTQHHFLDLIHPIMEKTTREDSEKYLRLKQYILLTEYLQQWNEPIEESNSGFIEFGNVILDKVILPGLVWQAGRSAEATRTACLASLCALLEKLVKECSGFKKTIPISIKHFGWLFDQVRPTLIKMLEDDSHKIRLYSLRALVMVMNIGQELGYVTLEHIHKCNTEIIDRLDDQNDDVRLAAVDAIKEVWKAVPKDYDLDFYYVHIQYAYTKTLVHLDDPNEQFQQHVMDCIKDIMKVHPESLIEKIEETRPNFINQKALDELEQLAKEILKNKRN